MSRPEASKTNALKGALTVRQRPPSLTCCDTRVEWDVQPRQGSLPLKACLRVLGHGARGGRKVAGQKLDLKVNLDKKGPASQTRGYLLICTTHHSPPTTRPSDTWAEDGGSCANRRDAKTWGIGRATLQDWSLTSQKSIPRAGPLVRLPVLAAAGDEQGLLLAPEPLLAACP